MAEKTQSDSCDSETPSLDIRALKRVFHRQLRPVLTLSGVMNVLVLAAPIYMIQLFDRVLGSASVETLVVLTIAVLLAHALFAFLDNCRQRMLQTLGAWVAARLNGPMLDHCVAASAGRQTVGRAAFEDIRTVREFIGSPAFTALLDAPWVGVFLAVMWLLHPVFGAIAVGGALTLFAFALLNDRLTRKLIEQDTATRGVQDRMVHTAIENADTIVAMGMSGSVVRKLEASADRAQRARDYSEAVTARIAAISRFVRLGLQTLTMGAGAWLAINGEIASGAMIAASVMLGRALAPVEQSISGWRSAVRVNAARVRLESHLTNRDTAAERFTLPAPTGALVLDNIGLKSESSDQAILQAVNLRLRAGESLLVSGPCGAGKSSLIEILVGVTVPTRGEVRLDGARLDAWPRSQLGRHVGYLSQSVDLLEGTVAETIARHGEVDSGRVIEAAQLVGVHELILALPQGYETRLGHGGQSLSGGMRQRLALARAVYGDIRLLVLDEPTANLDRIGERALLSVLDAMKARAVTVVLVTHAPALFRHIDTVLSLKAGRIERLGPMVPPAPPARRGEPSSSNDGVVEVTLA